MYGQINKLISKPVIDKFKVYVLFFSGKTSYNIFFP